MKIVLFVIFISVTLKLAVSRECQNLDSLVSNFDLTKQVNGSYNWLSADPDFPLPTDATQLKSAFKCVLVDFRMSDPADDGSIAVGMNFAASSSCCEAPNPPHCADIFTCLIMFNSNTVVDGQQKYWESVGDFPSGVGSDIFRTVNIRVLFVDDDVLVCSFCVTKLDGCSDPRFYIHVFRRESSAVTLDDVKKKDPTLAGYLDSSTEICSK